MDRYVFVASIGSLDGLQELMCSIHNRNGVTQIFGSISQ